MVTMLTCRCFDGETLIVYLVVGLLPLRVLIALVKFCVVVVLCGFSNSSKLVSRASYNGLSVEPLLTSHAPMVLA
jgi:hypothetical protein